MTQSPQTNAKGFSKAFWVSNTVELFERMAYYAVFIVLTIYLSNILGFNDFEASMISGLFSGGLYLLPIFTGAYADKIGFRKSMIIAFSLLSAGYLSGRAAYTAGSCRTGGIWRSYALFRAGRQ